MWRFTGILLIVLAGAFIWIAEFGLPRTVRDRLPEAAVTDRIEAVELRTLIKHAKALIPGRGEAANSAGAPGETSSAAPHPDNADLTTNEAGLAIIMRFEGLRLVAYQADGVSCIGYGHRMAPGEPAEIDAAEAERLLRQDLMRIEDGVKELLARRATPNQFSAMVSLAYTLGVGRFESASPVLVQFNSGDIAGAADAFRTHNRAGGEVAPHLVERRELERQLFLRS